MFNPYTAAQVNFKKTKEIGAEGKNSTAYTAHDEQLDCEIVIKQIDKVDLEDQGKMYFEESRALYASAHPNVVQIHYACQDDGFVYIAMPFYKNGSLKSLMKQRFLTIREIVRFGCQVLSGLHNVHSKELIHFDVKPDNVMISDRGEALLSDFGLTKPKKAGFATPDLMYGKIAPPEYYVTDQYTTAADIYQFGLCLYRMCNGDDHFDEQFDKLCQLPGDEQLKFVSEGKFPDRKSFLPHVPAKLRKIVVKCLEVDPDKRYDAALHVANDLASIEGEILDWQFDNDGDARVWSKATDDITYCFTVQADGKAEMTKTVGDGKAKRVTAACKSEITSKEIEKILGSY